VVCQFLAATFQRSASNDSLHHLIGTIRTHRLCFIPNFGLGFVVDGKVKGACSS
jgi:hypothetical protein